ncbi:MAG: HAD family hydrolase [Pseudobdellovibrionaceae bacterium]
MKYKSFSKSIWDELERSYSLAKKANESLVAAFDADGTLWDTDFGEAYFSYQIENKLVPLPDQPWEHYHNLKLQKPEDAYLWLAQIHQGVPLPTVHEWAKKNLDTLHPVPFFEEQVKLIQWLHDHQVKVFVITASVKWSVEPGANALGIPADNVLGVETVIDNGLVTSKQNGAITYRAGKVEALLQKTKGQRPFFASGNSNGDIDLLSSATHMALAVTSTRPDDKLYKAEQTLQKEAEVKNWIKHSFI